MAYVNISELFDCLFLRSSNLSNLNKRSVGRRFFILYHKGVPWDNARILKDTHATWNSFIQFAEYVFKP